LASNGNDPIQGLERPIDSAKGKGDRTKVMEDLMRFLESPGTRKHRSERAGANASPRQGKR
jgi:hypothetical protein